MGHGILTANKGERPAFGRPMRVMNDAALAWFPAAALTIKPVRKEH
jgi:hypothetical protein